MGEISVSPCWWLALSESESTASMRYYCCCDISGDFFIDGEFISRVMSTWVGYTSRIYRQIVGQIEQEQAGSAPHWSAVTLAASLCGSSIVRQKFEGRVGFVEKEGVELWGEAPKSRGKKMR